MGKALKCLVVGIAVGVTVLTPAHAAPVNDHFADRKVLSSLEAVDLAVTTGATMETLEPKHAGLESSGSLWWSWTAPYTGVATFSVYGSGSSPYIAVYTGSSLGNLSEVGSYGVPWYQLPTKNGAGSCKVPVVLGTTYQIAVAQPKDNYRPGYQSDLVVLGINQAPTIVSDAVVNGVVGASLQYQVAASNEPTSYTASGLPEGMNLNPFSGYISGKPRAPGSYDVQITASNESGTGSAIIRCVIAATEEPALPKITHGAAFVTGMVGASFSYSFWATGQPTEFTAINLPPGLSLSTAIGTLNGVPTKYGMITGTPTESGDFRTALRAVNALGHSEAVVSLRIRWGPPMPVLENEAVSYGIVGAPFNHSLRIRKVPYENQNDRFYWVRDLPSGLTFNSATASIIGTPTQAGTFGVPILVSNSGGTVNGTLTIVIKEAPAPTKGEPRITSPAAATGVRGSSFSYAIKTANPATSYVATGLPDGLAINSSTGVIAGSPSQSGDFTVSISAINELGTCAAQLTLGIVEPAAPVFISPAFASGVKGSPFQYYLELDPSTVSGSPALASAKLPPGLTAQQYTPYVLQIGGTPTLAGTFEVPITATQAGIKADAVLTIFIASSPSSLPTINAPLELHETLGAEFKNTITCSPGATLSVSSLPDGLTFDDSTGVISGYPVRSASSVIEVSATNGAGASRAKIKITIKDREKEYVASSLSVVTSRDRPVNHQIYSTGRALGGFSSIEEPYSVIFNLRGLPPGLHFDGSLITGTPAEIGVFPVDVLATTMGGTTRAQTLIYIQEDPVSEPPLEVSPVTKMVTIGAIGSPLSFDVWPTANVSRIEVTGLPPGMTWVPLAGTSNGIPTQFARFSGTIERDGTFPIRVTFSTETQTASAVVSVTIPPAPEPPEFSYMPLVRYATVGEGVYYGLSFLSDYHNEPTSYRVIELPPGLALDPVRKCIAGTPTKAGVFTVELTATNYGGDTRITLMTIVSSGPEPKHQLFGYGGCEGIQQQEYLAASATGYMGVPFAYYISSLNALTELSTGALPPGLHFTQIDSFSGIIEGVPAFGGIFPISLTASDAYGTTSASVTLAIHEGVEISSPPIYPRVTSIEQNHWMIVPGENFTVTVEALSSTPVTGFHCTIEEPNGIEVESTQSAVFTEISQGRWQYRWKETIPHNASTGYYRIKDVYAENAAYLQSTSVPGPQITVVPATSPAIPAGNLNENFDGPSISALLDQPFPACYAFNGTAVNTSDRRGYISTAASDYLDTNFSVTLTYTLPSAGGEASVVFIGIGEGGTNSAENNQPSLGAYLRCESDAMYPSGEPTLAGRSFLAVEGGFEGLQPIVIGQPGSGTHRARITRIGDEITFAIDADSNAGEFHADYARTLSITADMPFLNATNSRIFFGTQSGSTFDDLAISIIPEPGEIVVSGWEFMYDGSPKPVSVTTNPAGLAVDVTYNGNAQAPTLPGSYEVAAKIQSDRYSGSATGTLVISKIPQIITFDRLPGIPFTNAAITLSARADSRLTPVTFSLVSGPASLSGNKLTLTGVGPVTVQAAQAGDLTHAAASVRQTFQVGKRPQTITFEPIAIKNFSRSPFSVFAGSSEGLPVTIVPVSGPAAVTGSQVTMKDLGMVSMLARQDGNATVAAAAPVERSFKIVDKEEPKLKVSKTRISTSINSARITCSLIDNHRPAEVQFRTKMPGQRFGNWKSKSLPGRDYKKTASWTIPTRADGTYSVEVRPVDAAGNVGSSTRVIVMRK